MNLRQSHRLHRSGRTASTSAPSRFPVIMQVMASAALTAASGGFRARLRVAHRQLAMLDASPLIGGDEKQIPVAIDPASGDHLMTLLLAAYGLTARERQICSEVIGGHSTSDIASRLFISTNTVQDHLKTNTVQDHLKSVFSKVAYAAAASWSLGCDQTAHCTLRERITP